MMHPTLPIEWQACAAYQEREPVENGKPATPIAAVL
jgi:hypothetical protein